MSVPSSPVPCSWPGLHIAKIISVAAEQLHRIETELAELRAEFRTTSRITLALLLAILAILLAPLFQ